MSVVRGVVIEILVRTTFTDEYSVRYTRFVGGIQIGEIYDNVERFTG